jgi:hypothetical protein
MSLRRDAARGVIGTRSLSFFEGSFKANFAMLAKLADQTRSISGADRFLEGERFPGEPHDFHFLRTETKAGILALATPVAALISTPGRLMVRKQRLHCHFLSGKHDK